MLDTKNYFYCILIEILFYCAFLRLYTLATHNQMYKNSYLAFLYIPFTKFNRTIDLTTGLLTPRSEQLPKILMSPQSRTAHSTGPDLVSKPWIRTMF